MIDSLRGIRPCLLILSLLAFSCAERERENDGNEGLKDSTALRNPSENFGGDFLEDSLHVGNSVRIELANPGDFDWESFKRDFDKREEGDESLSGDVAAGPWTVWNEFQYRRVYRYVDDGLWLQTYYRPMDSTGMSKNAGRVLLDSQNPDYRQMGPLWSDMLMRGTHLSDSLH